MKKCLTVLPALMISSLLLLPACGTDENGEGVAKEIEIDSTIILNKDYESVTFEAKDGLEVSANHYQIDNTSPIIVLCHQARFNKFEYDGIAQRLNEEGFNCLAIDQRSGGPIAKEQNETNLRAVEQELPVDYLDAIPDIQAAIDFAASEYDQKIILWGSSYSSTLVLWEALNNDQVRAVVSFSPGDYFPELGSLTDSLSSLEKPFFITSADFEVEGTNALLSKTELREDQVQFAPESNGHHGSRALWPNQKGGEQYWGAILEWLAQIK